MQNFVLLADRRSGTTLVIDCLNNLPRVQCEKRAFGIDRKVKNPTPDHHSGMFYLYRTETIGRRLRFWTGRKELIREFLDARIFRTEEGKDIRGFRLIYNKADQHPEILDALRGSQTKIIHLVRENVLKTYISFLTAPLHKMHHPREGDTIRTVRIHMDPSETLAELRRRNARIEKKRRVTDGFDVLEVTYESFVADRDAEAARIQPFLGLQDVTPFETDLVKINPDSMREVIENYDEIEAALAGTEFERFLA